MSKIPTPVWVCITVAFLGVLGTLAYLASIDADAAEVSRFINVVMNLGSLMIGGGGLVYAGIAARNTNGDLDARMQVAAQKALSDQRTKDTAPGGELRRG